MDIDIESHVDVHIGIDAMTTSLTSLLRQLPAFPPMPNGTQIFRSALHRAQYPLIEKCTSNDIGILNRTLGRFLS